MTDNFEKKLDGVIKGRESAFPTPAFTAPGGYFNCGENGMNKRELIAMHIMAGFRTDPEAGLFCRNAAFAVEAADALLEELGS